MAVGVYLLGVYVELYEFSLRIPFAMTTAEQPVETGTDKNHDIGILHYLRAAREGTQRMIVRQQSFRHRHRVIRNTGGFHQFL